MFFLIFPEFYLSNIFCVFYFLSLLVAVVGSLYFSRFFRGGLERRGEAEIFSILAWF
jgi:hypothetical protein